MVGIEPDPIGPEDGERLQPAEPKMRAIISPRMQIEKILATIAQANAVEEKEDIDAKEPDLNAMILVERMNEAARFREQQSKGFDGLNKLYKQYEVTGQIIQGAVDTLSSSAAADVFPVDEDAEPEVRDKQRMKQDLLSVALQTYNIPSFYDEYSEIVQIEDDNQRQQRIARLKDSLQEGLNATGQGSYDDAEIEKIFIALVSDRQLTHYEFFLKQVQIRTLLNMDMKWGTNVTEMIDQQLSLEHLSPQERLVRMQRILREVAQVQGPAEGVVKLKQNLPLQIAQQLPQWLQFQEQKQQKAAGDFAILKKLNLQQKKIANVKDAGVTKKILQTIFDNPVVSTVTAAVATTAVFDGEPGNEGSAILYDHIDDGREALVGTMLDNPSELERTSDGYKGNVEGEVVHLVRRDGELSAFLEYDGQEIPIANTDPEAMGFDLARSKKIALQNKWADIANSRELRWLLMDEPADEMFMNDKQAMELTSLTKLILGKPQIEVKERLYDLRIVDGGGKVDWRYVVAYKNSLKLLVGTGSLESLKLPERYFENLVQQWKEDGPPKELLHA